MNNKKHNSVSAGLQKLVARLPKANRNARRRKDFEKWPACRASGIGLAYMYLDREGLNKIVCKCIYIALDAVMYAIS